MEAATASDQPSCRRHDTNAPSPSSATASHQGNHVTLRSPAVVRTAVVAEAADRRPEQHRARVGGQVVHADAVPQQRAPRIGRRRVDGHDAYAVLAAPVGERHVRHQARLAGTGGAGDA